MYVHSGGHDVGNSYTFDAYMDFRYGSLASGFWGQVGFAAMTSFIVLFFGLVGLRFLEHGFYLWHK